MWMSSLRRRVEPRATIGLGVQAVHSGQGAQQQTDAERHGNCGDGHTQQRFPSAAQGEAQPEPDHRVADAVEVTSPSRTTTSRSAYAATRASWVTMITVVPWSRAARVRRSMTSSPFSESNAAGPSRLLCQENRPVLSRRGVNLRSGSPVRLVPSPYRGRRQGHVRRRVGRPRLRGWPPSLSQFRSTGQPLPKEEVACLLKPGETATFEVRIPHQPIPIACGRRRPRRPRFRATASGMSRPSWPAKLTAAATFSVPEPRLQKMMQAGLLHLDIASYGFEPDGSVAATIGGYNPIGSESSPIIQYFDSVGWHDLARRSLNFFLDMQHDDGFMQNFGDYMLETGAALWSMGEHFRYTRDLDWMKSIKEKLRKSCNFMLAWRQRNMSVPRGEGHGMMEGKVADPEDPFRTWMLNGYVYMGLQRCSEMLADLDPAESARLAREADSLEGRPARRVAQRRQVPGRTPSAMAPGRPPPPPGRKAVARSACSPMTTSRGRRHLHLPRFPDSVPYPSPRGVVSRTNPSGTGC